MEGCKYNITQAQNVFIYILLSDNTMIWLFSSFWDKSARLWQKMCVDVTRCQISWPSSSESCPKARALMYSATGERKHITNALSNTHLCKLNLLLTSLTQISQILCVWEVLFGYLVARPKDAGAHKAAKCPILTPERSGYCLSLQTVTPALLIVPIRIWNHGPWMDVNFPSRSAHKGAIRDPLREAKSKPCWLRKGTIVNQPNDGTNSAGANALADMRKLSCLHMHLSARDGMCWVQVKKDCPANSRGTLEVYFKV